MCIRDRSPFRVFRFYGESVGVVEVHGHEDAVGGGVGRFHEVADGEVGVCAVSRHAEETCGVASSCSPDRVDECLVPFVEHSVLLASVLAVVAPTPAAVVDLVERLENQEIAFVGTSSWLLKFESNTRAPA